MKAIRACVPWSAASNLTIKRERGRLLINPGKPLRDDGLSGAVWMTVKKARSGWEASLPGGPTLGTSTRQEGRKQV